MHPADLADHRARRHRQAVNALERDCSRLAPHLDLAGLLALSRLRDGAHDGSVPVEAAHAEVRARLSQQARAAA